MLAIGFQSGDGQKLQSLGKMAHVSSCFKYELYLNAGR